MWEDGADNGVKAGGEINWKDTAPALNASVALPNCCSNQWIFNI